jgi:nidogen-like/Big-like domain-containing protein/uncharacterized protein DUF5801/VWA domain-containing protein/hemolysin type calcium-binding protein
MNGPFVVAQANTGGSSATPVQVLKLIKPQAGHTDILHASFTGTVKVDFTAIANDKITLFHDSKNQSLHVIFADGSQIIIEPFFDSRGTILANLIFEMGPNQFYSGQEFAQNLPITEDPSVVPAAGDINVLGGGDFHDPSVDPLGPSQPLDLLPPEELPNIKFTETEAPFLAVQGSLIPTVFGNVTGLVEEEQLSQQNVQFPSNVGNGNEDVNDLVSNNFDTDDSAPQVTQTVSGTLAGLVVGGDLPITFLINSAANGSTVHDSLGNEVKSHGEVVQYVFVNSTEIQGWTSPGEGGGRLIFTLDLSPDGSYTFTLNSQLDDPFHSTDDGTNPPGIFEETLKLDLSAAITAHDATPDSISFPANSFDIGVIDDTPQLGCVNDGQGGDQGGDPQTQFAGDRHPGEGGNELINGLGGSAGFGEQLALDVGDDNSSAKVDVSSIFPTGMNFFGTTYNDFYINNNGNITFKDPLGTYTPFALTGPTGNPIIAPFFADVDTRGAVGNTSPGGTSTGANRVYLDFDTTNGVITITWDDVGYYGAHADHVNAFQLVIYNTGGQNFSFEFRYENVDWTTGDASGGSGGLGGVVARAGWNSGNGTDFFELPQSGNQSAILALETTSNPGTAQDGNWVFNVVGGEVTGDHCVTTVAVDEDDLKQPASGTATYQGNNDVAPGDDLNAPSPVSATGDLGVLYGADGPGELIGVQYTGPALTSHGKPVVFVQDGAVWYGRVLDDDPATPGDQPRDVFKLEINFASQTFTFTLLDNLDHPLTDNPATPATTETSFEDNLLLQFGVTVTDYDGDAITTTVSVNVDDDVPTAQNDFDSTGILPSATGNVITGIDFVGGDANVTDGNTDSVGADGPGRITKLVGDATDSDGSDGFSVTGAHGTLTMDENGNYTYVRSTPLSGTDIFTYTLTDGDGDSTTATLTINLDSQSTPLIAANLAGTVEEEQLQPSSGTYPITASGNEDIDDLSGNDTDIDPAGLNNVTNVTTGSLAVSGGDGTFVYNLAGAIEGTQVQKVGGGGLTSEGAEVLYHQVSPGHFIGYVNEGGGGSGFDGGDRVVFALDFTSNVGDYTFTLYDNVDHPTPTSGGPTTEETLAINLNNVIVVDDEAGQTALVQGSINIIDDVPLVHVGLNTEFNSSHVALELDETVQPDGASNPAYDNYNTGESESAPTGGSNGGADDVAPGAPNVYNRVPVVSTAPAANQAIGHKDTAPGLLDDFFTGFLTPQFGADGPAAIDPTGISLKFSLAAPTLTNLFATDTGDPLLAALSDAERAIYLVKISDTVVEGHLAGFDGPGGAVTGDEYVAFRLTLNDTGDPSTSTISVDQFLAIDHDLSDNSAPAVETPSLFDENVVMKLVEGGSLGLELDVTAKDGDGDTATSSTTANLADSSGSFLSFDDDGPTAVARAATVGETQTVASDVVLIIDTSGSMGPAGNGNAGSDPDGAGPFNSRLEMVKAAVQELFASGAVHSVFIVDFNSTATFHSGPVGGWFTNLTDAMNVINALTDSNNTDYDSALQAVTSNFTAPPPGGDRLVSMFLSDGIPNEDNGTGSIGIDEDDTDGNPAPGGEETDWINFLTANGFDASYALGFGGLGDPNKAALEPIAWTPGETADNPYDADLASGLNDPNVLIVNDLSTIDGLVHALITAVGGSAAGNVITNATVTTADDASFGIDGRGFVGALHYDSNGDGVVNGADVAGYTFNGSHLFLNGVDQGAVSEVTFTPNGHGGSMHFNFLTGAWDYTAPDSIGATFIDRFTFTLVDGDNDTTPATTLDITVPGNEPPVAGDDIVIKNVFAAPFSVPEWAFLLNDTDPNSNPIDITGVSGAIDLTVGHTAGSGTNGTINITDPSFPGGLFNYTVSDGALDDIGSVTVINDGGDITGTSAGEIIVGDANGNTFDGAGGNDAIFAGDGNDTLIGGAGDDWLTSGPGNDNFVLSGLSAPANGHDMILDFVSGSDDIFVDVASQALTIGTAAAVAAGDFHTGDETNAATWAGGSGANEFVWNNTTKELWYSANGTGSDKIDLAHVSTGVPTAADVHTF